MNNKSEITKLKANRQKLTANISSISRINPDHQEGLRRLNIETVRDILWHFPTRYADIREEAHVANIQKGNQITLYGVMEKVTVKRSFRGHVPMTEARAADDTGTIRCIWFNQAYIGKMYPDGTKVKIAGQVQEDSRGMFLSNPTIERLITLPEHTDSLFASTTPPEFLTPIYRETKGVSSLYIHTIIKKIIASGTLEEIDDPIPQHITKKLHLPEFKDALLYIHFQKN